MGGTAREGGDVRPTEEPHTELGNSRQAAIEINTACLPLIPKDIAPMILSLKQRISL